MALTPLHDLHRRRFGRNMGLLVVLLALVGLVFALTVVKITRGDRMQGYDHTYQVERDPATQIRGADQ